MKEKMNINHKVRLNHNITSEVDVNIVLGDENNGIKLCPNGDIFVKGKLAENDKDVVNGMREFLGMAKISILN